MQKFQGLPLIACATPTCVAGIDEAGRGCLAGPVVAAAVVLPKQYTLPQLTDSKALSHAQRNVLQAQIRQQAIAWGLGVVWQKDIDRINILQATFVAMAKACATLHGTQGRIIPQLLHIDGNKTIPTAVLCQQMQQPLPAQQAFVKGDATHANISAASILAKTFRDKLMMHLHRRYPLYGFDKHKGYGTKEHLCALQEHGPCLLHRQTFAGVAPQKTVAKKLPQQGVLI